MSYFLSLILFTPLVGALLLLLRQQAATRTLIRWIANVVALVGFLVSVPLWFWYNPQNPDFQFVEQAAVDPVDRRAVLPRRRRLQRRCSSC